MKDELGERMKSYYENRSRHYLTRRTYTIIRIDGKAFHTYTKGLQRPFDDQLMEDMNETACFLCKNIQGAKLSFVQSDEISILVTDFEELNTDLWFDGNIQKMVSVSASLATGEFNRLRLANSMQASDREGINDHFLNEFFNCAFFDSRVFQIPTKIEVENYFIWRQQDTVRNSIQSVAQSLYSQKELHGKHTNELQEMIFQKGINWNDYSARYKRGRTIVKEKYEKESALRTRWIMKEPPIFTQDREFLQTLIPNN